MNPVKFFEIALGRPPVDEVAVLNLLSYKSLVGHHLGTIIQHVGDPPDGTKPLSSLLGYCLGMQGAVTLRINGETQRLQLLLLFKTDSPCDLQPSW